jgi:hypothetical protein
LQTPSSGLLNSLKKRDVCYTSVKGHKRSTTVCIEEVTGGAQQTEEFPIELSNILTQIVVSTSLSWKIYPVHLSFPNKIQRVSYWPV